MNRVDEAIDWISGLTAEEYRQKLQEAKTKYSKQLKPQVMTIMKRGLPKVQKQVSVNRLFLVTMWLEEHK